MSQIPRASVALLQGGLHKMPLSVDTALHFFGPDRLPETKRKIYMTLHAPDNKGEAFTAATVAYNDVVRRLAKEAGMLVLDAFAVTVGEASIDTTHYPKAPNIALAQLLLNLLAAMARDMSPASPVPLQSVPPAGRA